ncbi:MAG: FHA domain-containing protein [Myxococcales bacterium]|nr:FHA domain-containing protein [Myxococcales bacterium]
MVGAKISLGIRDGEEAAYTFDQERILLGRCAGADVRLPHRSVSLEHAVIQQSGSSFTIEDRHSTNGTWVNGVRVAPARQRMLLSGDQISVGPFNLRFSIEAATGTITTADRTSALARQLLRELLVQDDTPPRSAQITVVEGPGRGRFLPLPAPTASILLGRGETCQFHLDDPDISREHAEVRCALEGNFLEDLGSKNGIQINGKPTRSRRLRTGDEIILGSVRLRYEDDAEALVARMGEGDDVAWKPPAPATKEGTSGSERDDGSREPRGTNSGQNRNPLTGETPTPATPSSKSRAPGSSKGPSPTRRHTVSSDLFVYAFATIVLIVSIGGLLWLLQTR